MNGRATPPSARCWTASSAVWRAAGFPRGSPRPRSGSRAVSSGGSCSRGRCCVHPTCSCSTSRPTTSTSRASLGWPPSWPATGARSPSSPTIAGFSTRCVTAPGRWPMAASSSTRAATRRTCWPGPSVTGRRRRARTAAASSCARSWRGCAADLRRAHQSPSSGSTPPTRSSPTSRPRATRSGSCALPPHGWATRCSMPWTCRSPSESAGCSQMSPGASGRASGWRWWAPTARARRRSSACSPATAPRTPGRCSGA